jgi:hypothetical protein
MPPNPELTSDQRKHMVSKLLLLVKEDTLPLQLKWGGLISNADIFDVTSRTISKIWKRAPQSFEDPTIRAFRASPLKKRCGRHQKYNHNAVREAILEVPTHKRKTLRRKLAAAIGVSYSFALA